MPTQITNGWTGASLLPSSTVVASILNRANGPAASPASATAPTPAGNSQSAQQALTSRILGGNPFMSGGVGPRGLPSVPSVNPSGWGGGGGAGFGGLPNPRQDQFTPEQAYANYLTSMGIASTYTPQLYAAENGARSLGITQGLDPFGFALHPNTQAAGAIGNMQVNPFINSAAALTNNYQNVMPSASPYAFSYGTPAAHAPAPTPQWGYPTSYGQPAPGQRAAGFGF